MCVKTDDQTLSAFLHSAVFTIPSHDPLYFFVIPPVLSGLVSLFSGPDLSGISGLPLRVTSVRHASEMDLSEDGVEASAVTAVSTTRSIFRFSINHPFLFAVVDEASMTPLFLCMVTNPAPDEAPMPQDDPFASSTQSDEPVKDWQTIGTDVNNEHGDNVISKGGLGDTSTQS